MNSCFGNSESRETDEMGSREYLISSPSLSEKVHGDEHVVNETFHGSAMDREAADLKNEPLYNVSVHPSESPSSSTSSDHPKIRSPDSGYSDSGGESNSGHSSELETPNSSEKKNRSFHHKSKSTFTSPKEAFDESIRSNFILRKRRSNSRSFSPQHEPCIHCPSPTFSSDTSSSLRYSGAEPHSININICTPKITQLRKVYCSPQEFAQLTPKNHRSRSHFSSPPRDLPDQLQSPSFRSRVPPDLIEGRLSAEPPPPTALALTPNGGHSRSGSDHCACSAESAYYAITENREACLKRWVSDIRLQTETECLNTLQSKSLLLPEGRRGDLPKSASSGAVIKELQRKATQVSTHYAHVCLDIERQSGYRAAKCRTLVGSVTSFLKWVETVVPPPLQTIGLCRQIGVLRQICGRIIRMTISLPQHQLESSNTTRVSVRHNSSGSVTCRVRHSDTQHDGHVSELRQFVDALGHAFTKCVDLTISLHLQVLVHSLEDGTISPELVHCILRELASVCLQSDHLSTLTARTGGVVAILPLCLEPDFSTIALRALAAICCVPEAIASLDKAGGVHIIKELLSDAPHKTRCEAAAVLAQVSSPWLEGSSGLHTLVPHVSSVVSAVTGLLESRCSSKVLLLGSTLLANLTFLASNEAVLSMVSNGTLSVLLAASSHHQPLSLFVKDQLATILASMSSLKAGSEEVLKEDGVPFLVSLLSTEPSAVCATSERVQQKAAIAVSRLCTNDTISSRILKEGGGKRLVQLCKEDLERNNSDAVLVACLAAIRKLASSCSSQQLATIDASDLIEPRLLDSFLAFSSRRESFV